MSALLLEAESTLTERYQTTVPTSIREALHLGKQDKIRYAIFADGSVVLSRADHSHGDPVIGEFLSFLAQDMTRNPQRIQLVNSELMARVESLVDGVEIDLDAPLSEEDE